MWHVNEPACTIYRPELPFRNYRRRAVTKPCSLGNWLFSSFVYLCVLAMACICAFSALTLLVGPQEGHPPVKTEWCGTSVVICLERGAYGPAHATATHCLLLQ